MGIQISTDELLDVIGRWAGEFTSSDIAREISAQERSVRAAISWLMVKGMVESCGVKMLHYRHGDTRKRYPIKAYRLRPCGEVDFTTLNRVFVYGG